MILSENHHQWKNEFLINKQNVLFSLWDIEKTAKKKILYSGSGYSWEKLSFTPYNKYLGIKNNNWLEIWDFELYKKLRNFDFVLGPHEVFEF